jgi:hypothetical protein
LEIEIANKVSSRIGRNKANLDPDKDEGLPKIEAVQEKEIVSLLFHTILKIPLHPAIARLERGLRDF